MKELIETIRLFALTLPNTSEKPHFDKLSIRVGNKIFLTCNAEQNRVTVRLSENDQSIYSGIKEAKIQPVPNAWGKQGWTNIDILHTSLDIVKDAIIDSYILVAPLKHSEEVKTNYRTF